MTELNEDYISDLRQAVVKAICEVSAQRQHAPEAGKGDTLYIGTAEVCQMLTILLAEFLEASLVSIRPVRCGACRRSWPGRSDWRSEKSVGTVRRQAERRCHRSSSKTTDPHQPCPFDVATPPPALTLWMNLATRQLAPHVPIR